MTRHLMALCLCLLTLGFAAQAQTTEKPPAYKQYPVIPAFPLTLVNGQTITKNDLKKNVQTLVFIFSVECDHCKHMTEEVEKNISKFKNTQIVMITWSNNYDIRAIKSFVKEFDLKKYTNISIGTEGYSYIVQKYYKIETTPYIAVFNANGKLSKAFRKAPEKVDTLITAVRAAKG